MSLDYFLAMLKLMPKGTNNRLQDSSWNYNNTVEQIQLAINSIVATELFSLCRLDIPKLYGVPFNMRVYHASMLNPFIVMSSICIRTHINFSTCKCTENLRIYGHIQ